MTGTAQRGRQAAAAIGLAIALALVAAAVAVPLATGWEVHERADDIQGVAPLHGLWRPTLGTGTVPAVAIAVLVVVYGPALARRMRTGPLLATATAASLSWLLSLAFVDGPDGISRVLANRHEYLATALRVDDVPAMLTEFVSRIPLSADNNWPTHVAGHPPGALLFFVGLVRLGIADAFSQGIVVTIVAATIPAAVFVSLRALRAERDARVALPFLVLTPAALFLAVSADAVFTAVVAWGLALLALGAVAHRTAAMVGWSLGAGVLLGSAVMMSYGLPLAGVLALAVLVLARRWLPLPIAAAAAVAVVLLFAGGGFRWWEAYPVLVERYWDGIAPERPFAYWAWGNLAAFAVSAGPLAGAGIASAGAAVVSGLRSNSPNGSGESGPLRGSRRRSRGGTSGRVGAVLALAAALTVLLADLSMMSKAEVERIWLPFLPWFSLGLALLPPGWRRAGLAGQAAWALIAQHLLYTTW